MRKKKLIIVITSNRGLCGGYNANIIRLAKEQVDESTDVVMFGKKGGSAFRFAGVPVKELRVDLADSPEFSFASELADAIMEEYEAGMYKEVSLVYSRFISAGTQKPVVEKLLPLSAGESAGEYGVEPIFSPNREQLLITLVPRIVRLTIYKMMLDALASEHLARQLAMNSASDNASDMVRSLTLSYNRARQAQITTELSEIVGGAEALN